MDKEVGRGPTVSKSVKGRQMPGIQKTLSTEDIQLCIWIRWFVYVCMSEWGRERANCRSGSKMTHNSPVQWHLALTRCFRFWSKHPCQSNRTFHVDEDLNICLSSADSLSVCTKTQTKGWDEHLSSCLPLDILLGILGEVWFRACRYVSWRNIHQTLSTDIVK